VAVHSERGAKASDVPRVVLIVGEEATLRAEARESLRARALGAAAQARGFDEDRFDLAEAGTDPARVLVAARTLPMLAPRRWVEVRGLSERRAQAFLSGPLLDYLAAPSETTCLVLEAERPDRRQGWLRRIAEVGEVLECTAPSRPAQVRRWIEARLRARGKRARAGAAELLFEAVGADLDRLANEIDKLCLYLGERTEVEANAVSELTGELRERAIYELTDLVGQRRADASLRMLRRLLNQGEAPLAVLGALAQHFRRLLRARECDPLRASEVQRVLALHPYAAERLVEQTQRYSEARLRACLELAQRTDEVLKGALPLAPEHALEQLVLGACGGETDRARAAR
jgi:DNA polymerase-3 subunit delta